MLLHASRVWRWLAGLLNTCENRWTRMYAAATSQQLPAWTHQSRLPSCRHKPGKAYSAQLARLNSRVVMFMVCIQGCVRAE